MVIVSHGADGDRPRARTRPDLGGRGGHRRPVSAGSSLRLLRRMTRTFCMGRAARGARPLPRPREGRSTVSGGRPPRGHGQGTTPDDVRSLPTARLPDATDKGSEKPLGDGSSIASATASGSRCELPGPGRLGTELVAGDVLAVEPGLYRKGLRRRRRLGDIVLVYRRRRRGPDGLRLRARCLGRWRRQRLSKRSGSSNGPDRREVQALLTDDVLRDALDVLERDRVEGGQHLVRLAELAPRAPRSGDRTAIIPFGSSSERTRRPLESFEPSRARRPRPARPRCVRTPSRRW